MNAAIVFEPENFSLDKDRIMGCQSAGAGFLRALVAGLPGEFLYARTPRWQSAEAFRELVTRFDPAAQTGWIPPDRHDLLARLGTLHLCGPNIDEEAFIRLRHGAGAYSIVGTTYTLATHRAMDAVTRLVAAPVMPWDALVCISTAAREVVEALLRQQVAYLNWRFGIDDFMVPRLPVIPLGVHCDDFLVEDDEKDAARQALDIHPDEAVALYFGRLNFHAKAHPHAMFAGLSEAAHRTGRSVTLVLCGIFPHAAIEEAIRDGAARFAPGVRVRFLDGRDAAQIRRAFACADLFVSLADNIQETFGLTPLEAMAAGLPVVVSDWDGYKDTVRDGEDGFRIPTWMPGPPLGEFYAARYRAGMINYDRYVGQVCQNVAVDRGVLVEKLTILLQNPDLRRDMGRAGQARARAVFDWSIIFQQYQALWQELADIRARATDKLRLTPRPVPQGLDPFQTFSTYPTHHIRAATKARLREDPSCWDALLEHPLFAYARESLPNAELARNLLATLTRDEAATMTQIAERSGLSVESVMFSLSCLAKAGIVQLEVPDVVE
jgi:alpha-maltose-1-phosphate synthase